MKVCIPLYSNCAELRNDSDHLSLLAVKHLQQQVEYMTGVSHAIAEKLSINLGTVKPFRLPSPQHSPSPSASSLGVELTAPAVARRASRKSKSQRDSSKGSSKSAGSDSSSKCQFWFAAEMTVNN